jgi:hypothetical protein
VCKVKPIQIKGKKTEGINKDPKTLKRKEEKSDLQNIID